ncbi:snapalysin family zinc-dependent metalloprotease [Actinokineospora globicatena]|uniref:Uncharacterized protein n=1 Tax=Actinokineospora globicatena TaxID=103729 RepID=A0A9W6VBE1_9PSEU|nr:hypothetical protein Aglo03_60230 [Actinokineospora globicatena]
MWRGGHHWAQKSTRTGPSAACRNPYPNATESNRVNQLFAGRAQLAPLNETRVYAG